MTVEERFGSVLLKAWSRDLDFSQLLAFVGELDSRQLWPLSVTLYQTWLARNQSPFHHAGYFNLGVSCGNAGELDLAEAAYRNAISLAPGFIQPRLNLANLYERKGQLEKAIEEWRWVDQHADGTTPDGKPLRIMALNNLGRELENQKQYDQSLAYLTQSL